MVSDGDPTRNSGLDCRVASRHFSRRGERKCVRSASIRGGRWLARGGVLESPVSTTIERNEVVAHLSPLSASGGEKCGLD